MKFDLFFSDKDILQSKYNTDFPVEFEFNSDPEDENTLKNLCKNHDLIMSKFIDASGTENSIQTIEKVKAKFIFSNCAFMDIDNGLKIEELKKKLKNVIYFLYTSKSHNIEKDGITCNRFHVLFPLKRKVEDAGKFKILLHRIIKYFKADPKCKDVNRKFFGTGKDNKNFEFFSNIKDGELDIVEYLLKHDKKAGIEDTVTDTIETKAAVNIEKLPIGLRHNSLLTLVCNLVFSGDYEKEDVIKYINDLNKKKCVEPIPEKELEDIIEWAFDVYRKEDKYNKTENDMSRLFCDLFGNLFLWSQEKNSWYFFNGKFWELDKMLNIDKYLCLMSQYLIAKAKQIEDDTIRKVAIKWGLSCGNKTKIESIKGLTKHRLAVDQLRFDTNKDLLNLENGTFDLKTFTLKPHNREDLITRIAPVNYEQSAKCPKWKATLDLMYDKKEVKDYMQKALSLSLSGHIVKSFHFLYGPMGDNGKTTTLNTIKNILGDGQSGYCIDTPIDSLVYKRNDSESGVYQSRLKGARLIVATECNMRDTLHTTFIKSFTGGDSITAREKYARYAVTFKPEGKLFISGNETLKINDDSPALWERVRLIEYNKQIPKEKIIKDFWDILYNEEASGILNWLIEGYKRFLKESLIPPTAVMNSINNYRYEEDFLQQFIDDEIEITNNREDFITSAVFHEQFINYSKRHSDKFNSLMSIHAITKRMKNKNFIYARDSQKRGFKGIRFKEEGKVEF